MVTTSKHDTEKPKVPTWNGDKTELATYQFDVKMYVKGIQKVDRYICGPTLIRYLGHRTKLIAQAWDQVDTVDEVDDTGACPGVDNL